MNNLKEGDNVLILWNGSKPDDLNNLVNELASNNKTGNIVLENSQMITESSRPHSTYDLIISNWLPPHSVEHSDKLLGIFVKLLKPSGKLVLKDDKDVTSSLKINGFVNVKHIDNTYSAEKTKFEVGAKMSLKLGNKPAVWKIDDTIEAQWNGDDDDDVIDDSQLLDEDDLKKPEKQTLTVCATTGKRKACADCSCGLAEELRGEVKDTPKSSCGSCYLGDAFRCSTCPYLGMPAFKPGEKVMLELNSDI